MTISEVRAEAAKSRDWTDAEDKIIWPFYEKGNPCSTMLVEVLAEKGFQRTENAIRSRGHKLRKWRYGERENIKRLANNLPWR